MNRAHRLSLIRKSSENVVPTTSAQVDVKFLLETIDEQNAENSKSSDLFRSRIKVLREILERIDTILLEVSPSNKTIARLAVDTIDSWNKN